MKRAVIFLTLFLPISMLLGLGYAVNGRVQAKPQMIDVGGTIATDTTWTVANSPYIITETVTVEAGVTLTVEAGVTVMTMMDQYLIVQGHLEAVGTAVDPILFTSINDLNTNSWTGPDIWGSANFENVTIRYADIAVGISGSGGGDVLFGNSLFEENSSYPIVVDTDALHRLKMTNVTFSNNMPDRIGINRSGMAGDILDLAGDVLLTSQPGLEAYEDMDNGSTSLLNVPTGFTLTLSAGVTYMSDGVLSVQGHLQANGTASQPVIFDERSSGMAPSHYLYFAKTGSALLDHTIIQDGSIVGLGIVGESGAPVILQDVLLENIDGYPIVVDAQSLHRLQMSNVAFQNVTFNRIFVDTYDGFDAITADVNLEALPGLDCYEFGDAGFPQTPPAELRVPDGITLTVQPGVKLCFGEGAATLVVNGSLQAEGTSTQPITFTSSTDSAPNQWGGIVLENGSAQLTYAEVRYGESNMLVNNTAVTKTIILQNSQIHSAGGDGIWVMGGTVTAVCSSFNNNGLSGVLVSNTGNPVIKISSSSLVDNAGAGLQNDNAAQIDARNNWWGDISGPGGIGSGAGDAVQGNVLFAPWLKEEICTTLPYQLYLAGVIEP
ncbi:MAG: right-handed parallel beta-helix repeat-containing protein [Ardenticatenaceae bacterium]|nr:right-handed parallel beta-helix repeat-containing protein [Ardenticatenaceae bacterium]